MKRKRLNKLFLVSTIILFSALSAGFLVTETRDFKIAKNLEIFYTLFRELNTFYVDEINPDKIIKTGIDNMLKTLDPYTVYYPESDAEEFTIMTTGKYGGIGSIVRKSGDYTVISEIYKGFPADRSGIRPGDILKKVDGQTLKGLTPDQVSEKLKGKAGTEVTITIERDTKEEDHLLKREKISIPPVPFAGMIDSKTGYIRFTTFTQNCVDDVKSALTSLKNQNAQQIILDLRGNPGGLLTEAVDIVNLFVGQGQKVVSTKGKVKQFDEEFKTQKAAVDDKIPVAVLINRGSASASEIVAGAMQDLDRGIIVGQRSYGKGLVQISRPLSYNTQLKVTTARYYIPSGRCIQARDFSHPNEDGSVGIIPDSLIHEFKTRNGRTVKDGGGIAPDVEVQPESLSQVATELYLRNYIFDYATKYYRSHPEIKTPADFHFTDQDYADFRNYLMEKKFEYTTVTEESLKELVSNAKKEQYYNKYKEELEKLGKEFVHSLDHDLQISKDEITGLLEDEIISRYFYESGAIAWSVKNDHQVLKAIDLLNNPKEYAAILNGTGPKLAAAGSVNKEKDSMGVISIRGNHHEGSPSSRLAASL
jgi:carboxyl-terminal processing protease